MEERSNAGLDKIAGQLENLFQVYWMHVQATQNLAGRTQDVSSFVRQAVQVLQALQTEGEMFVATLDDLTAAVAAIGTGVTQVGNDLSALEQTVQQLRANGSLNAAGQAQLDAAVAQLQTSVSNLGSADSGAQSVLNPPAAPADSGTP